MSTLKRDKSIAKDQKRLEEMRRKLHTEDDSKSQRWRCYICYVSSLSVQLSVCLQHFSPHVGEMRRKLPTEGDSLNFCIVSSAIFSSLSICLSVSVCLQHVTSHCWRKCKGYYTLKMIVTMLAWLLVVTSSMKLMLSSLSVYLSVYLSVCNMSQYIVGEIQRKLHTEDDGKLVPRPVHLSVCSQHYWRRCGGNSIRKVIVSPNVGVVVHPCLTIYLSVCLQHVAIHCW